MTSSNFLSVTNGHVDALVSYVLDVKPYHVKLLQVGEEYLFEDTIKVEVTEDHQLVTFLGADLLDQTVPAGNRLRSASWQREIRSNGTVRTFQLPLVSHPKFLSHLNQQEFEAGVDDDVQISGLVLGSPQSPHTAGFSQRRWDGPGITRVTRAGKQLQEGWDFAISHGVFSLDIKPNVIVAGPPSGLGTRWKPAQLKDNPFYPLVQFENKFPESAGTLRYASTKTPVTPSPINASQPLGELRKPYGTITDIWSDITKPIYREWVLECTVAGPTPQLSVGYIDDVTGTYIVVGTATFLVPFNYTTANEDIHFKFIEAAGDPPSTPPPIQVGDKFVLTPSEKITVHPGALQQRWSLIKVNPMAFVSPVTFTPAATLNAPDLQVYARSLAFTPASYWTITFTSPTQYQLAGYNYDENLDLIGSALPGYPKTINLLDGCSYKDSLIHFTLLPTTRGFLAGDQFYFKIGRRKPTYLVFGDQSGFVGRAEVGKWFWNGQIGFKVPELRLSALAYTPTIATSLDGHAWTTVLSNDNILTEVTYVGDTNGFLISGNANVVASSLSAVSWQNDIDAIAVNGERALVVGQNGLIAMTELVAGPPPYTWYPRNSHTYEDLNAITFIPGLIITSTIPGLFVVVGNTGTILTSANGDAWMNHAPVTSNNLNDIAWAGAPLNIIVVVGNGGTIVRSTDALTWTLQVSGTTNNLNAVEWLEDLGIFMAVGDHGTILVSPDGITWTQRVSGTTENLLDLAFQPITMPLLPQGRIAIIGQNGAHLTAIDGGFAWTLTNGAPFRSITFGTSQNVFVAVGGGLRPLVQFQPLAPVHPMLPPSVYTVTFVTTTKATVKHNIYGYRRGLEVDQPWADEFVSFKLTSTPSPFQPGDVVKVYVAHNFQLSVTGGYETLPYEDWPYDVGINELPIPDYLREYLPLVHSQGTVIVGDFNLADPVRQLSVGQKLVIDKAYFDLIRLRLPATLAGLHPELAMEDGWIPLEFRYSDRVNAANNPISTAEFSDLATRIDAYLAGDPSYLVFTLTQPKFMCTNRAGSCTLTFSSSFFSTYLPVGTKFTVRIVPDQQYTQRVNVKVSEDLSIYVRFRLFFFDGPPYANDNRVGRGPFDPPIIKGSYTHQFSQAAYNADITKTNPASWYPLTLVTTPHPHPFTLHALEGSIQPISGYDLLEYDEIPYDTGIFGLGRTAQGIVAFSTTPADRPWVRYLDGVTQLYYLTPVNPLVNNWHQNGNFTQVGNYRNLTIIANPALNNFALPVQANFEVVEVRLNSGAPLVPGTDYDVDHTNKLLNLTVNANLNDVLSLVVVEPAGGVMVYSLDTSAGVDEVFTALAGQTTFTLTTPPPFAVVQVLVNSVAVPFTVNYPANQVIVAPLTGGETVEVTLYEFTQ
jgi:photosystem II stability/assembly factor-like uncharacterized protein